MSRYQVLGVELPTNNTLRIQEQVNKIYHDYKGERSNISFQLGIVNEMLRFYNYSHRSDSFAQGMRDMRIELQQKITRETGLVQSFRENMPLATIVIDVTKSNDELLGEMNSWAKSHVRKSLNHNMVFRTAEVADYENFYNERMKIAWHKWFNTIAKDTYYKLMDYLTENNCGNIFIATKDDVILWWSIAVYDKDTITYLYGFSNRDPQYRNIGVHQFIKYEMFGWARSRGLHWMDLFGGAPTGFPEHPLSSVSGFKESLGGIKVEWYGNYDIVLNPFLYKLFKRKHLSKK